VGETTDVVEKEMYTFTDRGGRSITLRPELSASMVRSYLENGMSGQQQPVKLWNAGPMFRYERPQKGRYRQFWQLDFEAIGAQNPLVDAEVIDLSLEIFRRLGLRGLEVKINSVGCPACRPAYKDALRDFLKPHFEKLCPSCRDRYDRNPLRILDCKNPECKAITEDAPQTLDHLCNECREHFEGVESGLRAIGVEFGIDKRLVRGLDYYTKTAYEVLSGDLGAQNAVCGGGRYDNLAEAIGGNPTPGVGFAAGVERIVLSMEQQGCDFGPQPRTDVYVASAGEESRPMAFEVMHKLRNAGISSDMDFLNRSLKAQFKTANTSGVRYVCVIGEDELRSGKVTLKDMETGEQQTLTMNEGLEYLERAGIARARR
jgi:histidyl-tRNA synthetase